MQSSSIHTFKVRTVASEKQLPPLRTAAAGSGQVLGCAVFCHILIM